MEGDSLRGRATLKALHSKKVAAEKDAFLGELLAGLPNSTRLEGNGDLAAKARRLHERFIAVHLLQHYRPAHGPLRTNYFEMIASHTIECECLFVMGFYNSGMILLRSSLESAIKLAYYENHPIEWQLHKSGKHDLHAAEYREFLYSVPGLGDLPFHAKASVERLWSELCKFVHCDLRTISQISIVADIKSALELGEQKFAKLLLRVGDVSKVIVACCLSVDPTWLMGAEKLYFDAVLDVFTAHERKAVKDRLRIS